MVVLYVLLGIIVFYFLFMITISYTIPRKNYTKVSKFYKAILLANIKLALFVCGVRIKTSGKELIDAIDGRFLLVSNHLSNLDPIVTIDFLGKHDVGFISKRAVFKKFCIGRIIRKICCLPINRKSPRQSMETVNFATNLIINNACSMGVYPEGTRNRGDAKQLLPFHDGMFKIAKKANIPIVVVCVYGTQNGKENIRRFRRTNVSLDVLKVIPKETVQELTTHELSRDVRELMTNCLNSK